MQDHPLGHSGAVAPEVVEHLDLVTAELRRRIAGIGLAIAELREETGRLRASADGRYHAVAVLDRPLVGGLGAGIADADAEPQPVVVEPTIAAPEAAIAAPEVRFEPGLAEPVSPWRDAPAALAPPAPAARPDPVPTPVAIGDVAAAERSDVPGSVAEPQVVEPNLTWVPEPGPVAVVVPAAVVPAPVERSHVPSAQLPAEPAPSLWTNGDDEDSAAFEAFFSAEIEPEPSQRWLLSD